MLRYCGKWRDSSSTVPANCSTTWRRSNMGFAFWSDQRVTMASLGVAMVLATGLAASHAQADPWTITVRGTITSEGFDHSDRAGLFGAPGAPLVGLPYSATITTDPSLNSNIESDTPTFHSTFGGSAISTSTGRGARYILSVTVNGILYVLTESNPFLNRSYLQSVRQPSVQDQVFQDARSLGCKSAYGACTDWHINAYSSSVPFLPSLDFNQSLTVSEALNPLSEVYFSFRDADGQYTRFTGSISTVSINQILFASFAAKAQIDLNGANNDGFAVEAQFRLGVGNNGINPLSEMVTIGVGTGHWSIPAGSFKPNGSGGFVFRGFIGTTGLGVLIQPRQDGSFGFGAAGAHANLTGTANPVPVTLTIGDDGGSTGVVATFY
jgi:hypothetical protein